MISALGGLGRFEGVDRVMGIDLVPATCAQVTL
jgi:hypothetical protein